MLNSIIIMGRLTHDPELKSTQGGIYVTSFTLAVERDFKENGEKVTDFIDCVAWRSTAEFVCRFFSKGRMAAVKGSLQLRDYKDRYGNKRRAAEVVADSVYFGDSNNGNRSAEYGDNDQSGDFTPMPDTGDLPFGPM